MLLPWSGEPILLARGRLFHAASCDRAAWTLIQDKVRPAAENGALYCDGTRYPIFRGPTLESMIALVADLNRAELVASADEMLRKSASAPAFEASLEARAIDAILELGGHLVPALGGGRLAKLKRTDAPVEAPIDRYVQHLDARLFEEQLRAVKARRAELSGLALPATQRAVRETDVIAVLGHRFRSGRGPSANDPRVAALLQRSRDEEAAYLIYGSRISVLGPARRPPVAVELEGRKYSRQRTLDADFSELLLAAARARVTAMRSGVLRSELEALGSNVESKKLAFAEYLGRRSFAFGDFSVARETQTQFLISLAVPEYALRNAEGAHFIFPSAQVGITLTIENGELAFSLPFVVGTYRHPFIRHAENTREMICLGGRMPDRSLSTVEGAVQSLLMGRDTLMRGYITGDNQAGMRSGRPWHPLEMSFFSPNFVAVDDRRIRDGMVPITNQESAR